MEQHCSLKYSSYCFLICGKRGISTCGGGATPTRRRKIGIIRKEETVNKLSDESRATGASHVTLWPLPVSTARKMSNYTVTAKQCHAFTLELDRISGKVGASFVLPPERPALKLQFQNRRWLFCNALWGFFSVWSNGWCVWINNLLLDCLTELSFHLYSI